MSKFSGKYDLYDCLMSSLINKETGRLTNLDELECFEEFKRKTSGIIYQRMITGAVTLSKYNIEKELNLNPALNKVKDGYIYWGKFYKSLSKINKDGYTSIKEIKFDTLLDLIPYYPYIIASEVADSDKILIMLSANSNVDSTELMYKNAGFSNAGVEMYRKNLQNHYLEVCRKYFLPYEAERTIVEDIKIDGVERIDGVDYYIGKASKTIDYMHPVEYMLLEGKIGPHYTSPKLYKDNKIIFYKIDIDVYLKDEVDSGKLKVKYIEAMKS